MQQQAQRLQVISSGQERHGPAVHTVTGPAELPKHLRTCTVSRPMFKTVKSSPPCSAAPPAGPVQPCAAAEPPSPQLWQRPPPSAPLLPQPGGPSRACQNDRAISQRLTDCCLSLGGVVTCAGHQQRLYSSQCCREVIFPGSHEYYRMQSCQETPPSAHESRRSALPLQPRQSRNAQMHDVPATHVKVRPKFVESPHLCAMRPSSTCCRYTGVASRPMRDVSNSGMSAGARAAAGRSPPSCSAFPASSASACFACSSACCCSTCSRWQQVAVPALWLQ